MRIAALLLAAGTGRRYGGATPKQFVALRGRAVIRHAAEALLPHVTLLQPVGDAALLDAHATPAHQRLACEELFAFSLGVSIRRAGRLARRRIPSP